MIIKHDLLDLFQKFIAASQSGKRRKNNGERISAATIRNYETTLKLLTSFSNGFPLELHELRGNNKKDFTTSKRYHCRLYKNLCDYLSQSHKSVNNYTGQNIKVLRTFYKWCQLDLGIATGDFYKSFHVLTEDVSIITLSIEQLNFLIYNKEFEATLSAHLKKVKDVFVVGCSTGLRISDLRRLTPQNIIYRDGHTYLHIRSKKTSRETLVRIAPYCLEIIARYAKLKKTLLPITIDTRFNRYLKEMCALAGWNWHLPKYRKMGSKSIEIKKNDKRYRFCDLVTSHTMRRTCITNMLYSGMPEHIVRKISGHAGNSKSFYRYVNLAQQLADQEINKLFDRLTPRTNLNEKVLF